MSQINVEHASIPMPGKHIDEKYNGFNSTTPPIPKLTFRPPIATTSSDASASTTSSIFSNVKTDSDKPVTPLTPPLPDSQILKIQRNPEAKELEITPIYSANMEHSSPEHDSPSSHKLSRNKSKEVTAGKNKSKKKLDKSTVDLSSETTNSAQGEALICTIENEISTLPLASNSTVQLPTNEETRLNCDNKDVSTTIVSNFVSGIQNIAEIELHAKNVDVNLVGASGIGLAHSLNSTRQRRRSLRIAVQSTPTMEIPTPPVTNSSKKKRNSTTGPSLTPPNKNNDVDFKTPNSQKGAHSRRGSTTKSNQNSNIKDNSDSSTTSSKKSITNNPGSRRKSKLSSSINANSDSNKISSEKNTELVSGSPPKAQPPSDINDNSDSSDCCIASTGSTANQKPQYPNFERYKKEKEENDVKLEVLRVLRRDTTSKPSKQLKTSTLARVTWNKNWGNTNARSPKIGFVYIYKCDSFPKGYVKIGQTSLTPEERLSQWKRQCDNAIITHITDPNDTKFAHFEIAEKLTHAELWNKRKKYACNCRNKETIHDEWFEMEANEALEVVEKWRRWVIEMRPYKRNGLLHARWYWKHDQSMSANPIDLNLLLHFTGPEKYQCCIDTLSGLLEKLWQAATLLLFCHELVMLGIGITFIRTLSGADMISCTLLVLILYLLFWYNYS